MIYFSIIGKNIMLKLMRKNECIKIKMKLDLKNK